MNKIEQYDALISKYLSGNALPEEAMQLADWRNANIENERYFLGCENIFNATHKQSQKQSVDKAKAWKQVNQKIQEKGLVRTEQKRWFTYLAIAATLTLIMSLALLFEGRFKNDLGAQLSFETSNTAKEFTLQDSSEIALLQNAKLVLDKGFGVHNRTVYLKGNASFTVTHKDDLPFIVDAGNFYIKDIGTKFSVHFSLDADTVYVEVFEGIVLLYDSLGAELELKASQKASYVRSQKQLLQTLNVATQNMLLKFDDTPLREVILQLNERYHTQIEVENKQLEKCGITTEFHQEDLQTILNIICETLNLSVERTANGYLIKGKTCLP